MVMVPQQSSLYILLTSLKVLPNTQRAGPGRGSDPRDLNHFSSFAAPKCYVVIKSGLFIIEVSSVFDELDELLPVDRISLHGGYVIHLLDLKGDYLKN